MNDTSPQSDQLNFKSVAEAAATKAPAVNAFIALRGAFQKNNTVTGFCDMGQIITRNQKVERASFEFYLLKRTSKFSHIFYICKKSYAFISFPTNIRN